MPNWSLKGRYLTQVGVVMLVTVGLTVLMTAFNFRSGWSIVWMLLLPFALGFAFNRDAQRGSFMAMVLTAAAFAVTTITGGLLGY